MSNCFHSKQQSRLAAILGGDKKLDLSRNVSDVPVSLASWTPRAETLPLVLLSLLEQSLRPSTIHVWLCPEDRGMLARTQRAFFVEHGVQFHEVENIGPHKKWLPLIESGHEEPFVVVDDDIYYPRDCYEALVTEGAEHRDEIVSHRCHRMILKANMMPESYSLWEKGVSCQRRSSHNLFPVGCGGIFVRPDALSEQFRDRSLISELCPRADDIWLKAAYIQSGFKCRKSCYDFPCLEYPGTTQSGLALKNVDQNENDKQLNAVFDYFDLRLE